jgi:uncharacterized protein YkwD
MNRKLLTLMLGIAGALPMITAANAQQFDVPASAKAEIIDDTNAYRKSKGLPPLRESESASRVAETYARYLAEANKTGHSADGRDPVQRLHAENVKFCKFRGENWHESWTRRDKASPGTAMALAMRFWKTSPGHERALRSASTDIGVGVAGWKHGDQWVYQEIQIFIDNSCLKGAEAVAKAPSIPDRNPERAQTP